MTAFKPQQFESFFRRRMRMVLLTLAVCIGLGFFFYVLKQNLWHSSHWSGHILMASIVYLAAFNLRKKLPFLPFLGSAAMWMQIHIYVGLSTFLLFGFHVAWRIPNGQFEIFLSLLYLAVAFSGVYGLYITRVLPKRLTAVGEEVIYERIPFIRKKIAGEAKKIALQCTGTTEIVAKFYLRKLLPFFEKPRSLAFMICPTSRKRRQLESELEGLDRYLEKNQRTVNHQLAKFVRQKDELDYHLSLIHI